jgi:hypothetical protein
MTPELGSQEINTNKESSVWSQENYGGIEYDRLADFPPKVLLDYTIANHIIEISKDYMKFENGEPIKVAELFAGRAPISRTLKEMGELNFECHAFDKNEDMRGGDNLEWVESYKTDFDASETFLEESEKEKYDWVIIENGLYATSISEDGTRKYTKREAEILRTIALQKAMYMLKPGGFLVISDALDNTSNFGLKRIKTFLQKDVEARKVLKKNEKGVTEVVWEYVTEHIKKSKHGDKNKASMLDVLKRNKEFVAKAQLFTHEENLDLFRRLGMNERVLLSQANDYLGSNGTYILRKLSDIESQDDLPNQLGEPISLKYPIHEKLLDLIGRFRRKVYKETKATDNLPIIDEYDKKKDGLTIVYPNKNHIGLAAVATLQPNDKEIGLDVENLMVPEDGNKFYKALEEFLYKDSKKVKAALDKGRKINFAEIRRLAADNLSRSELMFFIGDLWRRFPSYAKKEKIDIVLFITDEKRLRLFNHINRNGGVQFKKVEGLDLDREDEELQTMMVSASNYFFGSWDTLEKEQVLTMNDISNINKLKSVIVNGNSWRETANQLDNSEEIIHSVEKLLHNAPSNVYLYYTDYSMPSLD